MTKDQTKVTTVFSMNHIKQWKKLYNSEQNPGLYIR